MNVEQHRFKLAKTAQYLFFLIGGIWLVLAGLTFFSRGGFQSAYWIIAVLMVGNGGALIVLGVGINRFRKLFFWLGLIAVGVNIFLTFTDQFGLWDMITLLIDLSLFGVLVLNWKHYLM